MFEITPLEETRAYQELVAIGMEKGMEKGILSLITLQSERKFGKISQNIREKMEKLSLDKLEQLGESLLDMSSALELEKWLNSNQSNGKKSP